MEAQGTEAGRSVELRPGVEARRALAMARRRGAAAPLADGLALGQGAYYLASGLWPIVHLPSFEAVTGPKLEGWLVKTVGAMIAVAGLSMMAAGGGRRVGTPTKLLAAGSAAALAAVDLWYAGVRRRIDPIYLADAAVELALLGGWAATWRE